MGRQSNEPAGAWTQFARRSLLCLAAATQFARPTGANEFRVGSVVNLSDPDALAACGSNGAEKDTCVVVNPTDPKNIVSAWSGGLGKGIVAGVTLDGGKKWQQVILPELTLCTEGSFNIAYDPWLAFTPKGELYAICNAGDLDKSLGGAEKVRAIVVSKSADGGLHWSRPLVLDASHDPRFKVEKPSITADLANNVYAVWQQRANGNRGLLKFTRSADGGSTWEPVREIFDPGNSDQIAGPVLVVLPDGTVLNFFIELRFSNIGGAQKDGLLWLIRSTDKGQTWSAPIPVATIMGFQVTDPDTDISISSMASYPPLHSVAADPHNGNVYAIWEDARFNNFQYNDIAFSMSADGGFTWSEPIRVNKTPANIAPANRQAFLPSVAVAADGTIGLTYYDFRFNDANWGGEVRLTETSFNIETVATPFGAYFLGDYQGLASIGNDFVAAWSQPYDSDLDSVFFRRVGP